MPVNFHSFSLHLSVLTLLPSLRVTYPAQAKQRVQGYGDQDFFSGIKSFPMFIENQPNFEGCRSLKSE